LDPRDNAIQLSDQVKNYLGAKSSFIHKLADARMAHRNQRKLDCREKSVHGHQSQ
jgi:hypothetical protein